MHRSKTAPSALQQNEDQQQPGAVSAVASSSALNPSSFASRSLPSAASLLAPMAVSNKDSSNPVFQPASSSSSPLMSSADPSALSSSSSPPPPESSSSSSECCPHCSRPITSSAAQHSHSQPTKQPSNDSSSILHRDHHNTSPRLPPWRKNLYERQPYEDSYTSSSFLSGLIKNAHIQSYDYWSVVRESTAITQQVSTAILFVIIFKYSYDETLSPKLLLALCLGILTASYAFRKFIRKRLGERDTASKDDLAHWWQMVIIVMVLLYMSPVLRTLTLSIADNSIWAMSILLLLLHLFTFDYTYVNSVPTVPATPAPVAVAASASPVISPMSPSSASGSATTPAPAAASASTAEKFSGTVSLNAAVFVAVMLASRLPSSLHAFALISFSFLLFATCTVSRHHLRRYSVRLHILLTVAMFATTVTVLFKLLKVTAIAYTLGVAFITFVCPIWLIYIQKFKDEINGPWDEAIIRGINISE